MKKLITIFPGIVFFFLFLFTPGTAFSVEHFMDSEKPNNGQILHFFKCDNNRMVKIIDLGGNRYQFFSVGGKDIMGGKSALEVAAWVCKHYLRTE